eukprot:8942025-Pyramimonas_sp.AAC.1
MRVVCVVWACGGRCCVQVLSSMRLAMKDELAATCVALRRIASHNYSVHEELLRTVFPPSSAPQTIQN